MKSSYKRRWHSLPSWLVSVLFHVCCILILATITIAAPGSLAFYMTGELESMKTEVLQLVSHAVAAQSQDSFDTHISELDSAPVVESDLIASEFVQISNLPGLSAAEAPPDSMNSSFHLLESGALMSLTDLDHQHSLTQALEGRGADMKRSLLHKYGGSQESEDAVERALHWLVEHQAQDGGWTFEHTAVCGGQCANPGRLVASRNGATALALLPFLGAGETHKAGNYRDVVLRGIDFLLTHQEIKSGTHPSGSWHEIGGTMYSHCLASIAICEAYAMTGDSRLREPAQLGLNYLVQTQDKLGGGWRYSPGDPGDTSVVGWAVMAFKSGAIGELHVPKSTLKSVSRFLDSVSSADGSSYGYKNPMLKPGGGYATTAIGVLCRMYEGWPLDNRRQVRGIKALSAAGPQLGNLYYTYYGAQVLRHHGGPEWQQWNFQTRDPLIALQIKQGHASGSWLPNAFPEMGGSAGGRLYSTCMAAMILEVYYRHMPLYSEKALQDEFKL